MDIVIDNMDEALEGLGLAVQTIDLLEIRDGLQETNVSTGLIDRLVEKNMNKIRSIGDLVPDWAA